jgi:hypothetical protein
LRDRQRVDTRERRHLPQSEHSVREPDDEEVRIRVERRRSDFGTGLEEVVAILDTPSSVGNRVVDWSGGGGGGYETERGFFIGIFVVRILIFVLFLTPREDGSVSRYRVDLNTRLQVSESVFRKSKWRRRKEGKRAPFCDLSRSTLQRRDRDDLRTSLVGTLRQGRGYTIELSCLSRL